MTRIIYQPYVLKYDTQNADNTMVETKIIHTTNSTKDSNTKHRKSGWANVQRKGKQRPPHLRHQSCHPRQKYGKSQNW